MASELIVLPPTALRFGEKAFVQIDDEVVAVTWLPPNTNLDRWREERLNKFLAADGRTLPRRLPGSNVPFATAVGQMTPDSRRAHPFAGPNTLETTLTNMAAAPTTFTSTHDRWVTESRIKTSNRSVHEHRVISKALQMAVDVDRLQTMNLSSFEYLNRRRELLEFAHSVDPDQPNFEGSHHFMGEPPHATGTTLSGALQTHVAAEFGKESAIAKERRKAIEAKKGGKS